MSYCKPFSYPVCPVTVDGVIQEEITPIRIEVLHFDLYTLKMVDDVNHLRLVS